MTRSDFPDNWHDLIAGYTLGNLTPEEQAQFDQLLQTHTELKAELAAYEAALAQLPQTLPLYHPPASLEDQILQRLHAAKIPDPQPWLKPLETPRYRLYWQGLGLAIAAGIGLLLGWDNYRLRRSLVANQQELNTATQLIQQLQRDQQQTETVLASLRTANKVVYSLEGTGAVANASGSVVTLAEQNTAILIPHNLPPLPSGKIYRFWAAPTASEALIYCGQFTVQQEEAVQWSLPEDACSAPAQQVVITVDPVTASTDSGGELVMQSIASEG